MTNPDLTPDTPPVFDEPPVPEDPAAPVQPSETRGGAGIYTILLLLILVIAGFFRFRGINWDEYQYVHPDERFLGFVENDILPVYSFKEYFDTANSTLNPMNRGHKFFVYGTLPIFLLRYTLEGTSAFAKDIAETSPDVLPQKMIEWANNGVFANYASIGRPLSGLFDLATIVVLYFIASKLFNRRVGLLAAAFSSFAVLQIQLSHFFTVDIFANFFIWLALYFAVVIAKNEAGHPRDSESFSLQSFLLLPHHPAFVPSLLFGLFAGMALASKISAYPLVLMLPVAAGLYLFRQAKHERVQRGIEMVFLMGFAGVMFLLAFRIFQPYAFSGPGFFDVTPNPEWIEALKKLQALLVPSIGYPPAVQWLNRPLWFSGYHLSAWGLGWPLAIAAWIGMLWMGWRIFRKREFQPYFVVWAWTTGHFIWQSLAFNPTMRYQLPIYPGMAFLAAWGISELWSVFSGQSSVGSGQSSAISNHQSPISKWSRPLTVGIGALVLLPTFIYALAFSGIYTGGMTRLTASRWMFDNLPGPINLRVQTSDAETHQQILSFPTGFAIRPNEPYAVPFIARHTGTLNEITLGEITQERPGGSLGGLFLQVLASPDDPTPLATSALTADFSPSPSGDNGFTFSLDRQVPLQSQEYTLKIELLGGTQPIDVCGMLSLFIQSPNGQVSQPIAPPSPCTVTADTPLLLSFVPGAEGALTGVDATSIVSPQAAPQPIIVRLMLSAQADFSEPLASAVRTVTPGTALSIFEPDAAASFVLDTPVTLTAGETYYVQVAVDSGAGQIQLGGTAIAVESSWDDPLPYRVDEYDPYGGIYQSGLNFEMYWFDDEGKRQRFYDTLEGADVVTMSSNRQWGSVGRLDQVYPISSAYYRYLLGCPEDRDLQWCYIVAEPGMFKGQLGFELIKTFDVNPHLGPLEINDQFAEEAFTVYDHPKVFIFAKTAEYDPAKVEALLGPLPLGRQLEELEGGGQGQPVEVKSLLLTPERLSDQQNGGTWSELFNADSVLNTFQPLAVIVWYLAVTLLGLAVYPLVRLALPGLADRGYPLARTAGMLILSYVVWLAGSFEIPVTRLTITGAVFLLVMIGVGLAVYQRQALRKELTEKWRYFLTIEGLMLAFFLFLLIVRLGNPDLWHPWKGGEKPMDFAYLNAVIRSTTYPPYDPWFAGGYINYYYYGFVMVGVLVKWLGIVPALAYNLILPTLFSMLAMGAFSVGWNLTKYSVSRIPYSEDNTQYEIRNTKYFPYLIGLAAALGIAVLGNLGTPKLILRGYEKLGAPPEIVFDETTLSETFFLTKWGWAVKGLGKVIDGEPLPIPIDHWYWNPSRAIPAPDEVEPITEFPFFTFLYADLHAHMMSLPITLLAMSWVVSVVLARGRWENWVAGLLGFLLAGITIGALRPTNTWDFPTYLALSSIGLAYGIWQGHLSEGLWGLLSDTVGKLLKIVFGCGILVGLAFLLYQPFAEWYALGYAETTIWQGTHTPVSAYLTHWGLFLFVIVSWMIWETLDWMAKTPVSALRTLKSWLPAILLGMVVLVAGIAYLMVKLDAPVSWMVMLLAAWAGVLLFRPGMSDAKRLVLFLTGTGLVLTQTVEVIVLSGDIARMNTVFKFYLQVWVLFSVSAAASLGWLAAEASVTLREYLEKLSGPVQRTWQVALALLVFGAAMYPIMGGMARMKDRMVQDAPLSLNGQDYLTIARYNYNGIDMNLDEDYRAMRWLEENVQGSPTIVEAQLVEYTWGSRMAINTGLPAVLGWNWHQRQQRTGHDADVWQRSNEITEFYNTGDQQVAVDFLNRNNVRYIIIGQLERSYYHAEGLAKFELWNGQIWHEVYRDGQTVIYEVGGS